MLNKLKEEKVLAVLREKSVEEGMLYLDVILKWGDGAGDVYTAEV